MNLDLTVELSINSHENVNDMKICLAALLTSDMVITGGFDPFLRYWQYDGALIHEVNMSIY